MASSDDIFQELRLIQERQKHDALIDVLFFGDKAAPSSSLLPIHLSGQARLPLVTNQTAVYTDSERLCLVLTREENASIDGRALSLLLPLASRAQLKLVSFAAARRPLSKSVLLGLNTLLVNRDNALFDNLPWSEWSIDPQKRNRDAAGNPIEKKFHLGKRDAYNRFLGKDWQGRSLAIGNMALRLKYMLEADEPTNDRSSEALSSFENDQTQKVLATRVLQLQLRELQMDLADIESQLAIARNNDEKNEGEAFEKLQRNLMEEITTIQSNMAYLMAKTGSSSSSLTSMMDRVAEWTTDNGENKAPYRGAMGYAPILDSKQDIEESLLPYTSPYDLLKEILADQLNAKVIGCILENTSILRGNLALGGAIVLQRITPSKTMEIAGEKIVYNDYDEELGNAGIKAGEIYVVECDGDEAIGVALAHDVPLKVESEIFERAAILVETISLKAEKSENIIEFLSIWKTIDPEMKIQVEGEALVSQNTNPISIPRTSTSLFNGIFENKKTSSTLFPTDNPIKSLEEYDALSNEDKAKTLLEMSNFSGRLPRPRVLRTSPNNPLDDMLLPLIDESVRRQYNIREAENRGDFETAAKLREGKSKRQVAKDRAEDAREIGNDNDIDFWEYEAEFLESLRADVTQDEGTYSRFLDRDYWYEKERQATAKRVDRSKFGNLLDGIE